MITKTRPAIPSFYYCKHCGKTLKRDSDKAWIKSFCDSTGTEARPYRIDMAKRWNGKKMSHGKKNLSRPVKSARNKPTTKKK